MTHAGTIDLGGSAQTKQSGNPWPAVMLTLVVVVATIAAVWFASSAGLVGGTASKPAAGRSDAQIEAQRSVTLAGPRGYAVQAQSDAVALSSDQYLNGILERAHAAPFAVATLTKPVRIVGSKSVMVGESAQGASQTSNSMTSGTFHPGKNADDLVAPVKRDRVGGP